MLSCVLLQLSLPYAAFQEQCGWQVGLASDFPEGYSQMPPGLHQLKANQDNSKWSLCNWELLPPHTATWNSLCVSTIWCYPSWLTAFICPRQIYLILKSQPSKSYTVTPNGPAGHLTPQIIFLSSAKPHSGILQGGLCGCGPCNESLDPLFGRKSQVCLSWPEAQASRLSSTQGHRAR